VGAAHRREAQQSGPAHASARICTMKNGLHIDEHGNKCWYLNGKLHRQDGPALEWANGTKAWYLRGKCHRQDGPAVERADGTKYWYLDDKCHRQDGPAVEWPDGTKFWYLDGKCHRTDGPAQERADGTKRWYLDGKYLGDGDAGFWALWKLLTDEKRNCLNLHMHLPGAAP
jgi:hypothetical protein